jgi:hypothetical protein
MAYISKEDVKAIRDELKATFPKFKFGVRKSTGSMSVIVNIKQGPTEFSDMVTMLRLILTTLVSTVNTQNSLRRLLRSSRLLQCVARVTIRKVGMIVQTQ